MFERGLQGGYIGGKWRDLGYGVGELIERQAVSGTYEFLNESRGGIRLKFQILYLTEARIDHQGQVQSLPCFRLEEFYLLLNAFLEDLELILCQVERGAAVFVEHTGERADQVNLGADACM